MKHFNQKSDPAMQLKKTSEFWIQSDIDKIWVWIQHPRTYRIQIPDFFLMDPDPGKTDSELRPRSHENIHPFFDNFQEEIVAFFISRWPSVIIL